MPKSLIDLLNEFTLTNDSFGPLHEMGWKTVEYVKVENAFIAIQEHAGKYRVVDNTTGEAKIKTFGHDLEGAMAYFKMLAVGHTRDLDDSRTEYHEQTDPLDVSLEETFGEHKPLLHLDEPTNDEPNPTLTKRKPVEPAAPETPEQEKARVDRFYTEPNGWIDVGQSAKDRNNWVRLRKKMGNFRGSGGYRYDVISKIDGVSDQHRFGTRLPDAKAWFEEIIDSEFLPDPTWPDEQAITSRWAEATDPGDALIEHAPDIPPPAIIQMATPQNWQSPALAKISWYGDAFQGKPVTWSKAPEEYKLFDKNKYTAANWNRKMLGKKVKMVYGDKAVVVWITDRGPHPRLKRDFDLSEKAATYLGFRDNGLARVKAHIVDDSTPLGPTSV